MSRLKSLHRWQIVHTTPPIAVDSVALLEINNGVQIRLWYSLEVTCCHLQLTVLYSPFSQLLSCISTHQLMLITSGLHGHIELLKQVISMWPPLNGTHSMWCGRGNEKEINSGAKAERGRAVIFLHGNVGSSLLVVMLRFFFSVSDGVVFGVIFKCITNPRLQDLTARWRIRHAKAPTAALFLNNVISGLLWS